ncbi:pectate lyase [Fontisphaera persica]|uniref:pectate lyase n=1 Tax=Fontisphaera persica TaxID=2974023 RepID=UPI0024C0DAAC|nr:pectate lyase [Fontisphaera persica]WCJ58489.1 pectate lyase [Fontisphaera persica]
MLWLFWAFPSPAQRAANFLQRPPEWWKSEEADRVTANILSYQSPLGGWPKNTATAAKKYTGKPESLKPTFDNGATTDELRFLARRVAATGEPACRQAFERGLDYLLKAQYPNGGWPQFYPPGPQYHRHITFNDHAMVRLMEFLRETWTAPQYGFLDESRRQAARAAFDRGIQCILQCQVRVNGELTAWCAQHDEVDFQPRPARSFEPVSLSGCESVGLVRLLMSLEKPPPEVIRAVDAAVAWLEKVQIRGLKVVEIKDPSQPGGKDRVVQTDPSAPPLWARFYELGTDRPIFCDRDGVVKYTLAEIGHERRNGYAWYGTWPQKLLKDEYPAWKKRLGR